MEQKRIPYYIGIDLCDQYAMVSFFQLNMKEPETVSTIAGSEYYQIPMLLAKRKGISQWYYGDDAKKMAKTSQMICVDALIRRAQNQEKIIIDEETYDAEELLGLFLKKIIQLPQKLGNPIYCDKLVLTISHLDRALMEMFWRIATKIGFTKEQFMVIDHKETFYYFALCQEEALRMHDVYLFLSEGNEVCYYALSKDGRTTPKVVTIKESTMFSLGVNKDADFLKLLMQTFSNQMISSVYLMGSGFMDQWMKESLTYLCRGRRAFLGNNLFSKGACYAGAIKDMQIPWNYIYIGENEMKFNLNLKVQNENKIEFYPLIFAGDNWFEANGECEVILSEKKEIDFWKQYPRSKEAKIETLLLNDLSDRPERATRVRITAKPTSDSQISVEIKDLGFGEFFKSTEKVWKYNMTM